MMKIKKPYFRVFIQILLLISLNMAISGLLHEQYTIINDIKIISAQETGSGGDTRNTDDINDGDIVGTCIMSKQGELCQEFYADECDDLCEGDCIYATRDKISECELGTCYDSVEGFCFPNSPKFSCLDNGGQWFSKEQGEPTECEIGCCVSYSKADMTTQRECSRIGETLGIATEFKPELDELECYNEFTERVKGACLIASGDDSTQDQDTCRFVSRIQCISYNGIFYPNILCSYPSLNTECEKQQTTGCSPGRDEVYWFDSCGNRENIFEGDDEQSRESSWNDGRIKDKEDSCEVGNSNDPLAYQDTCGNCDRIDTSTICGYKTSEESMEFGDFVCRDTSCIDSEGRRRENGESWCEYQGEARYDEEKDRAGTTPGSRHFLVECRNGEIVKAPCNGADYRDYICVQYERERINNQGNLSQAYCRINNADLCIIYNTLEDKEIGLEKCETNPDCYIKQVRVPKSKFRFKACVPNYPKGFDLGTEEGRVEAESICSFGTLTCKYAKIKELDSSGFGTDEKWVNKGCKKAGFTQELNDFCMSLGDCGASVNYLGDYSGAYEVTRARDLKSNYIEGLEEYSEDMNPNEYIQAENIDTLNISATQGDYINIDAGGGYSNSFPDNPADGSIFVRSNGAWGSAAILFLGFKTSGAGTIFAGSLTWAGFMNAFVGAIIGAELVGFLLKDLEITGGITATLAYTLIGLGAFGAGLTSLAITTAISEGYWSWGGTVGIIILVAVIAYTYYLDAIGVGEVKKYEATFTCQPWTPQSVESNEDCARCYDLENGEGCSKYACESIGRNCKFLNEGTPQEECAYVPGPEGPPIISPLEGILPPGYEYDNVNDRGYKIKSNLDNECIPTSELLVFGIHLNEPGRCTYTVKDNIFTGTESAGFLDSSEYNPEDFGLENDFLGQVDDASGDELTDYVPGEDEGYEGMTEFYFGGHRLDMTNITHVIRIPSLEQLGVVSFDPEDVEDFYMNVYCEDTEGETTANAYRIGFCVTPQNKTTPPVILGHSPRDGFVKANSTKAEVKVYASYPSNCKWDLSEKEYNEMGNDFVCETNPDNFVPVDTAFGGGVGFECSSDVDVSNIANEEEKEIYVKCKDTQGNIMPNSYRVDLKKTPALEITSIRPVPGSVKTASEEPAIIYAELETAGGRDNGIARCGYWYGSGFTDFSDTFSTSHWQEFNQETQGEKTLYVQCTDSIGNFVEGESTFTINIDDEAPGIAKVFAKTGNLHIITDEPATCYYSNKNCYFELNASDEDANIMSVGLTKEHSTSLEYGKTYYIRCIDGYDNFESGCSKIVKTWTF